MSLPLGIDCIYSVLAAQHSSEALGDKPKGEQWVLMLFLEIRGPTVHTLGG